MRLLFAAAGTALGLTCAMPITAQAQNVQELLKGLTTGNQNQDQALHDAFERGYRKGRQDQARSDHSGRGESSNRDSRQRSPNDSRDYNNRNDGDSRDQGDNGYAR